MAVMNLNTTMKDTFSLCKLMTDREKIDTEDIIKYHPNKISIDAFEKIVVDEEDVYVYTFVEEPDKFAFAGTVLKKAFMEMEKEYDKKTIDESLYAFPFTVRLTTGKTKDGKNNITKVEKV